MPPTGDRPTAPAALSAPPAAADTEDAWPAGAPTGEPDADVLDPEEPDPEPPEDPAEPPPEELRPDDPPPEDEPPPSEPGLLGAATAEGC